MHQSTSAKASMTDEVLKRDRGGGSMRAPTVPMNGTADVRNALPTGQPSITVWTTVHIAAGGAAKWAYTVLKLRSNPNCAVGDVCIPEHGAKHHPHSHQPHP